MIYLGGRVKTHAEGQVMAKQALASGAGLEKLRSFVLRQGGDVGVIDDYSLFPHASIKKEIQAAEGGFVNEISAKAIGLASQHTGAGRATKEDAVDLAAGIYLHKKVGDKVNKGDVLATVYGNNKNKVSNAVKEAAKAFTVGRERAERPEMIKEILGL